MTDLWSSLTQEAAAHLAALVRINTTNPPGREKAAADYVAAALAEAGIQAEVVEPAPERGSVIGRLRGSGEADPLLLLAHLDVVPAVASEWRHDPFGGVTVDGEIWGRGTLDCKHLAAIWLTLLCHFKREGRRLRRDLILAATADEEMGGTWGVQWLADNRFDLIKAPWCLNEGGGGAVPLKGQSYFTYQTAEKAICWLKLTARGRSGHASVPSPGNAVVALAEAVVRLGRASLPMHVTPTVQQYFAGLSEGQSPEVQQLLAAVLDPATSDTALAQAMTESHRVDSARAMLRNTATPTVLRAGDKINVIPSTAQADVDCRILPGQTVQQLLAEVSPLIGDSINIEVTRTGQPSESPPASPLAEAMAAALKGHAPGARMIPFLVPGATDARFLRVKGMTVYGFCPTLPDVDARTVHGVDERLPLTSLTFALKVLHDTIAGFAG